MTDFSGPNLLGHVQGVYQAAGSPGNVDSAQAQVALPGTGSDWYSGGPDPAPAPSAYQAPPDPYAKYGGETAYNNLVNGFNGQVGNVERSSGEAAVTAGRGYNNSILDFVDQQRLAQNKIDQQGVQNELSKRAGTQGVYQKIGTGIKSGGVILANKNASNSSAAQALARAYGQIGRADLSKVGQQYASGLNAINTAQSDYGVAQASGVRALEAKRQDIVDGIVQGATQQLAAIDAAMLNASLPQRLDMEGEKNKIKNAAVGQLAQYGVGPAIGQIKPTSVDERKASAFQLSNQGVAPENAFQFSDTPAPEFQNTGGFPSQLPIFQAPRKQDQNQPVGV